MGITTGRHSPNENHYRLESCVSYVVDRGLNAKNKSTVNRQRFWIGIAIILKSGATGG